MTTTHLVRTLAPPCQRTLGSYFLVSPPPVLRQSGAIAWLRNVSPGH